MSEEKSKLVETVETTETTSTQETTETAEEKAFDAEAFLSENDKESIVGKYDEKTAEKIDQKEKEENEESESTEDEDGFSWDSVEVDEEPEEEKDETEEDEDWDEELQAETKAEDNESDEGDAEETKSTPEEGEINWEEVGKQLGLKQGLTKDDIEAMLNTPFTPDVNNETVTQLSQFLKLQDKDLLAEEMKADGMGEDEIEEVLDKMDDSGILKREAYRIRRQLKAAIEAEKTAGLNKLAMEDKTKKEQAVANRKELQSHLKQMETFMGGRVSKKDKQDVYKYITSGKMAEDIWQSHGNATKAAMYMLFERKFAKILRNQGLEDGKASILDKITSPNLSGKSRPSYKVDDGKFDPAVFTRE